MRSTTLTRRAVFLDRDGTINRDVGFTHRVCDLELLPRAVAGLARMAALGLRLFITTNQSGIARGYFAEADARRFHQALRERLLAEGIVIDEVYYCPFHPTEGLAAYRRESSLRKPADGMIRRAAAQHNLDLAASFAIGDQPADILAGQAAGCRTILLHPSAAGHDAAALAARPDYVAGDLVDAAGFIERTICATNRRAGIAEGSPRGRRDSSRRRSA
jgi:D-glycero-D-manno-heptose 1,7-bisphosphate phosphatase